MNGIFLTGDLQVCEECALAKAKQQSVPKFITSATSYPGEKVYYDITPMRFSSYGGSKNWLLIVDDYSDFCTSLFLKTRDETKEKFIQWVNLMENYGIKIKYVRCDNAKENVQLGEHMKHSGKGIIFQFTAPGTPQQNGKVERKFATLFSYIRATLNRANVSDNQRKMLWAEVASTVTYLHNMLEYKNASRYENFYGKPFENHHKLKIFGEMAIATDTKGTLHNKLENRGRRCIFIGYQMDSARDTYRLLNLETNRIIVSRDVKWLNKFQNIKQSEENIEENDESNNEDDLFSEKYIADIEETEKIENHEESQVEQIVNEDNDGLGEFDLSEETEEIVFEENESSFEEECSEKESQQEKEISNTTKPQSILRRGRKKGVGIEKSRLRASYNDVESHIEGERILHSGRVFGDKKTDDLDELLVAMAKENIMEEREDNQTLKTPTNYKEAWYNEDKHQRMKWREAIRKELKKMEENKVWEVVEKTEKPKEKTLVKSKWIFVIKRNGIFRARLVACGYSQIPGIDFSENYAPVIMDATYRLLLVTMMKKGLKSKLIDVETAFLHGDLEETVYMECPLGLENKEKILLLKKSIYGLVQAARSFFIKWKGVLKTLGYVQSKADPCLFTKGDIFIGTYVDDNLMICKEGEEKIFVEEVNKLGFSVKVEENLMDYLSCKVERDDKNRILWISQPHLLERLEKSCGEQVKNMKKFTTPGAPGRQIFIAQEGDNDILNDEEQTRYRSIVGMILFLVKHSRPDLANAVRELSKGMTQATKRSMKELMRTVKYIMETKKFKLKMQIKDEMEWKVLGYSDADWGSDKQTRLSINGSCIFFCGAPIIWRSKQQKGVATSSGESKYVALSEVCKDVKFAYMLLETMNIEIELPIEVRVDNMSAIFMAETAQSTQRTKHVDIRYHFVKDLVEAGLLKIRFVGSENNLADLFTKNLSQEKFRKFRNKLVTFAEI